MKNTHGGVLYFSKVAGLQAGRLQVNCTKSHKASHLFQCCHVIWPTSMLLHAAEYWESWKKIWNIGATG